jgi:formylglycine-generating enzyme required for sulfatase activity
MLQAREFLCIILLVASALPEAQLNAQTEDPVVEKTLEHQRLIDRHLDNARDALQSGRIDEPVNDSAWYHYRAVLDIDADNSEAQSGLLAVQEALVLSAIETAEDLDFDLAELILEDAAALSGSNDLIDRAFEEIAASRSRHAGELESKALQAMDSGNFSQAERELIELIAMGGADNTVSQLRQKMEEARNYGGFSPGQVIKDSFIKRELWTPESVIVLAGSYMMGSPAFEDGRVDNEGPTHRVTFRRGFAIGLTEVSVKEFRLFTDETGYRTDAEKYGFSTVYNHRSGRLTKRDDVTWEMNYEGKPAEENEPAVHVSWNDATAYVQWLASGTGKPYRLPTEAEFEYALRAGGKSRYWWGDGAPPKAVENLTGERDVSRYQRQWSTYFEGYEDTFWGPAPVASFDGNPFGLHDMAGNVGEWVGDCWHETYLRAPVDGSAWLNPGCKLRIIRGGYWASSPIQVRSAFRLSAATNRRDARIGFRIARDL